MACLSNLLKAPTSWEARRQAEETEEGGKNGEGTGLHFFNVENLL